MRTLLSTQSTKGPRAPTLTSLVPGNRTLPVIPVISQMPLISTHLALSDASDLHPPGLGPTPSCAQAHTRALPRGPVPRVSGHAPTVTSPARAPTTSYCQCLHRPTMLGGRWRCCSTSWTRKLGFQRGAAACPGARSPWVGEQDPHQEAGSRSRACALRPASPSSCPHSQHRDPPSASLGSPGRGAGPIGRVWSGGSGVGALGEPRP